MDKIFTTEKRYQFKRIGNLLQGKPLSEQAKICAIEMANIQLPDKFTHNGYEIEIISQPTTFKRGEFTELRVEIKASKEGQSLNVDDGIFEFRNPPIMVHDGTYHKEPNRFGGETDCRNYVEDPEQALKSIIAETIRVLNLPKGDK